MDDTKVLMFFAILHYFCVWLVWFRISKKIKEKLNDEILVEFLVPIIIITAQFVILYNII